MDTRSRVTGFNDDIPVRGNRLSAMANALLRWPLTCTRWLRKTRSEASPARPAALCGDPLLRLQPRCALRGGLVAAIARAAGDGRPVSVVSIGIDHFRWINTRRGPVVGEAVLRGVVECLHAHTRMGERSFRLADDKFLLILGGCDEAIAKARAEQLRRSVSARPLLPGPGVTLSLGVAEWQPGETVSLWLSRSAERLQQARCAGRDRVAA